MNSLGINLNDVEDGRLSVKKALFASTVCAVILSVSLAALASGLNVKTFWHGSLLGIFAWLAFNFTTMFRLIFWEDRPWRLFGIVGGYDAISFFVVGGIVGAC